MRCPLHCSLATVTQYEATDFFANTKCGGVNVTDCPNGATPSSVAANATLVVACQCKSGLVDYTYTTTVVNCVGMWLGPAIFCVW